MYILLGQDANLLYNEMLKHSVIVRPVGPQEIRVTIGLPQENKRFIEAFKDVMREAL
jgi:histidinol-phosphate aminotransferase